MIEKAARSGDQHIDAACDLRILVAEGNAADQERDGKPMIDSVLVEILLDLRRKFARGLEDQGARHARAGASGFEERQHRQHERRRLAGAGLSDAENVAAREHVRNRLRLDRRGLRVAGRFYGLLNFLAKSEFGKGHDYYDRGGRGRFRCRPLSTATNRHGTCFARSAMSELEVRGP